MFPRFLAFLTFLSFHIGSLAQQKYSVKDDLRDQWMVFEDGHYETLGETPFKRLNTIYLQIDPSASGSEFISITSSRPYYIFINGKVRGEFGGRSLFRIDSLLRGEASRVSWLGIHQDNINVRELETHIVTNQPQVKIQTGTPARPYFHLRDFVVLAGLVIIVLFLFTLRLNPKLASDYLSVRNIFSSRDAEDSQASARLTSGSNVQFYILCSLLLGFYLLIILYNLPTQYALTVHFPQTGFWGTWWQWLKLSGIVFLVLLAKVFVIFSLTRLFDMRGMARFHFFNWIRILLVALGVATTVLFIYFIGRGQHPDYYVVFLSLLVALLAGWIVVAFFKLSGRTGHSMFHLFSYLCATEIIPLLITVKVLFQ